MKRLALAILLSVIASRAFAAQARPNFILVLTDDQALGDMRAMPLVRELVGDRGVTFANAVASWPLCCPARATLLTGQYAHNHNVLGNYPPAGGAIAFEDAENLAVWLQRAGYATVHLGKYLNGYGSDRRGANYVPPGWDQWFGLVDPATYKMWGYRINHNGTIQAYGEPGAEAPALYQTDVLTQLALEQIDALAPADKPFFINLAYLAPHEEHGEGTPMSASFPGPRPAPRHRGSFDGLDLPRPPNFDEPDLSDKPPFVAQFATIFGGETLAQRTSRYRRRLESLRAVDEGVRAIVEKLATLGELERTYVVFTSDNGFFNGEHGIALNKYLLYEASIRVPLMVRGPGIPAGRTSTELVANVDFAPTLVELAGAKAGRTMDGRSFAPFARDPSLHSTRPVLLEAPVEQKIFFGSSKGEPATYVPVLGGLRTDRYAYVEYGTGEVELYDLERDPWQLQSVHDDSAHRDLREQMHNVLLHHRECAGDSCRGELTR